MSYERNVVATWERKGEVVRTISYSRIDNALSRLTYHILWDGQPGDVIELAHRYTGMQFGTMKVRVGNRIETQWVWDESR